MSLVAVGDSSEEKAEPQTGLWGNYLQFQSQVVKLEKNMDTVNVTHSDARRVGSL